MGLSVYVVLGDHTEEDDTSFDIGYMGYGNFRMDVVDALCGKQYGNIYRAKFFMCMMPFQNLTPEMARMISPDLFKKFNLARKPYPASKLSSPEEQATLTLFLEHSDTDGEFSTDQCIKLAALFRKYKRNVKDLPRGTQDIYKRFTKVFRGAAKSGGKVRYG